MMATLWFVLSFAITLVIGVSLAVAAVFLASPIIGEEAPDYRFIPSCFVLFAWLLVFVYQCFSLFGLFWWPPILLSSLLLLLFARVRRDDIDEPEDTQPFDYLSDRQMNLFWLVLAIVFLRLLRSFVAPCLCADGLSGHLFQAAQAVQKCGLINADGTTIFSAWTMLLMKNEILAGAVGFITFFIFVIAAYGVPRSCGASSTNSIMTAICLASTPFFGSMIIASPSGLLTSTFVLSGIIILSRYPEGTVKTAAMAGLAFALAALCDGRALFILFGGAFLLLSCSIPCRWRALLWFFSGSIILVPSQLSLDALSVPENTLSALPYLGPGGLILLVLGFYGMRKTVEEKGKEPALFLLASMAMAALIHTLRVSGATFWFALGFCPVMAMAAKVEGERADMLREVALVLNIMFFFPWGLGWVDFWPMAYAFGLPIALLITINIIIDKVDPWDDDWWRDRANIVVIIIIIAILPTIRTVYRYEYYKNAAKENPIYEGFPLDRNKVSQWPMWQYYDGWRGLNLKLSNRKEGDYLLPLLGSELQNELVEK